MDGEPTGQEAGDPLRAQSDDWPFVEDSPAAFLPGQTLFDGHLPGTRTRTPGRRRPVALDDGSYATLWAFEPDGDGSILSSSGVDESEQRDGYAEHDDDGPRPRTRTEFGHGLLGDVVFGRSDMAAIAGRLWRDTRADEPPVDGFGEPLPPDALLAELAGQDCDPATGYVLGRLRSERGPTSGRTDPNDPPQA